MTANEATPIEDVDGETVDTPKKRRGFKQRLNFRRGMNFRRGLGGGRDPALWAVAVLASVSLLVALLYWQYRPDQQTDADAAASALAAAREGTVAVFSYSASSFDSDTSNARSRLTGDFLSEYEAYVQSGVASVAKQNQVTTTVNVAAEAVSTLRPDSAEVLLFLNQTTITAKDPAPSQASRNVLVTLSKVDGEWLIAAMKPV